MRCPRCSKNLQQVTENDVTLDVCVNGCGGIWFDNFELQKFDEPHEPASGQVLDVQKDVNVIVDLEQKITCPKCENMPMLRHFFSVKREVQIDECPNCAGVWLDAGELETIRSLFASEQEKNEAAEAYVMQQFGEQIAADLAEDDARAAKARRFANMFRFICPSYYIPGKQSWGAF